MIVIKIKPDLTYRGFVCFEPVHPNVIIPGTNLFKKKKNFFEDISISDGLSYKEMITFSRTDKHQKTYAEKYSQKKYFK